MKFSTFTTEKKNLCVLQGQVFVMVKLVITKNQGLSNYSGFGLGFKLYTCYAIFNLNPFMANGFSHHYQLGESTFICKGTRCDFLFIYDFSMKFLYANRIALDGTPRAVVSHLGLYCLPMSHKKDAGYIS